MLWIGPSVSLSVLLLILGIMLMASCWRNITQPAVHYSGPDAGSQQALLLAGLVLGMLLIVGGVAVGYKVAVAPGAASCTTSS